MKSAAVAREANRIGRPYAERDDNSTMRRPVRAAARRAPPRAHAAALHEIPTRVGVVADMGMDSGASPALGVCQLRGGPFKQAFRGSAHNPPWYQNRWRDRVTLASDQNVKNEFSNTRRGHMIATSIGGS